MARSRNLKPGFFTNDDLGELDPLARLMFAGLWTLADRSGRLEDRPKKIKAEVLPYDNCDAEAFLSQLAERGFILRYEVAGKRFIQVLAWDKNQNPHCKESPSTIPAPIGHVDGTEAAPDKHGASPVQAQGEEQPLPERAGLIPDSLNLIPDSSPLIPREEPAQPRAPRSAPFPKPDDVSPQVWADWCQLRKAKKATVSETVLKEARAESAKAGLTLERFLTIWCARGSQGLQADWLKLSERAPPTTLQPGQVSESTAEAARLLGIDLKTDAGVIDA